MSPQVLRLPQQLQRALQQAAAVVDRVAGREGGAVHFLAGLGPGGMLFYG